MLDIYCVFALIGIITNILVMLINLYEGKGLTFGKNEKLFIANKVLLIPSISILWYFLEEKHNITILLFLIFSWIGDLLLLSDDFIFLILGGISFAASHFTMIHFYGIHWSLVPFYSYILLLPGTLFLFGSLIPKIKLCGPKDFCVILYCLILQLSFASATARSYMYPIFHPSFILSYLGYFSFLLSDYFLLSVEMQLTPKPRRVEIMGFYSLSEILIVLGAIYAL